MSVVRYSCDINILLHIGMVFRLCRPSPSVSASWDTSRVSVHFIWLTPFSYLRAYSRTWGSDVIFLIRPRCFLQWVSSYSVVFRVLIAIVVSFMVWFSRFTGWQRNLRFSDSRFLDFCCDHSSLRSAVFVRIRPRYICLFVLFCFVFFNVFVILHVAFSLKVDSSLLPALHALQLGFRRVI